MLIVQVALRCGPNREGAIHVTKSEGKEPTKTMAVKDTGMKIRALSLIFILKAHNHPNHPKIKGRNTFFSLRSPCRRQVAHPSLSRVAFGICCDWISLMGKTL